MKLKVTGHASRAAGIQMHLRIIGEISDMETIAVGSGIRELRRLRKVYGAGDGGSERAGR